MANVSKFSVDTTTTQSPERTPKKENDVCWAMSEGVKLHLNIHFKYWRDWSSGGSPDPTPHIQFSWKNTIRVWSDKLCLPWGAMDGTPGETTPKSKLDKATNKNITGSNPMEWDLEIEFERSTIYPAMCCSPCASCPGQGFYNPEIPPGSDQALCPPVDISETITGLTRAMPTYAPICGVPNPGSPATESFACIGCESIDPTAGYSMALDSLLFGSNDGTINTDTGMSTQLQQWLLMMSGRIKYCNGIPPYYGQNPANLLDQLVDAWDKESSRTANCG